MRLGTEGWYSVTKSKTRSDFLLLDGELVSCLQNSFLSGVLSKILLVTSLG